MRSIVSFCLFLTLGCRCVLLSAQTPAFLHYGVPDGLPSNLIYCGIQGMEGLLWFGTDKGLVSFDGTRFRTFGMKDGLSDPEVLNLLQDSGGRLWISNYRQIPSYRKHGRFFTEEQDTLLKHMKIGPALWDFYEDRDQSIWLCSQSSKFIRFSERHIDPQQAPAEIIRACRIGETLFLFGRSLIYRYAENGTLIPAGRTPSPVRRDINPLIGLCVSGNRVLYAYVDKLILMEYANGQFQEVQRRSGPVGRVFTDNSGRFWICSLASGATCFDNNRRDLSNPASYFKGEKVTAMFEDRQGTIWFCTTDNGIFALPKNGTINFTERDNLFSKNTTAIAQGPGGRIWVGDDEGNLNEFDAGHHKRVVPFGSLDGYNRVRRILYAPEGGRWVLTDEGLYYEIGLHRQKFAINVSLKNAILRSGELWFASSGVLAFIQNQTKIVQIKKGRYTALAEDTEGNVWAGSNEGFYCVKDSLLFNWGSLFPPLKGRIVAIERDSKNGLWVVSPGSGLLLVETGNGQVKSVQVMNDLLDAPIDNIQSVFQQPGGPLWMATNRGVYGLRRENSRWTTVHFDHHNGLADNDVNAVLVQDDTLWAATVGGLSRILLKSSGENGDFHTYITSVQYHEADRTHRYYLIDSARTDRIIRLPPGSTLFEIELAGLDFKSRGNLLYRCVATTGLLPWHSWTFGNILSWLGMELGERPDTAVVNADKLNFGVSMPPGRYHFQVTAITGGGIASLHPDSLIVLMYPHWYETVWFWLLLWGAFFAGLWRFLSARAAFRKLDQEVSELQLRALQAQMNPHFVGNSINAIQQFFYPPDPLRASQYIAVFTRLLRRTMLFSEQTFIPFAEELAYDRDYLDMIKLRLGDRFRFEIEGADAIPPDFPFPSMILQPILENATLHGLAPEGDSVLICTFCFQAGTLVCTLTDNGVGFQEAQNRQKTTGAARKSKGLEMLRQKVATLNRRYSLTLEIEFTDLSGLQPPVTGSRVVIRYKPENIALLAGSP